MPQPRLAVVLALVSVVLVLLPAAATCATSSPPFLVVRASNGGSPFQGDSPTLVTVSPNGDHFRDTVTIHYWLSAPAYVRLDSARHGTVGRRLQADLGRTSAGAHVYWWTPPARPAPASYALRLQASLATATVVVHVQGVDIGAARAAYRPGDTARLSVRTDARHLTVDVLGITDAAPTTRRNDKVQGMPAGPAFRVGWDRRGDHAYPLNVPLGHWSSGVYFVRVRADDGRVGFTPIVLRPRKLGSARVAIVMPTYTWQAYNFYDCDGDGRGDTWYAGWRRHSTRMGRPYLSRGVPRTSTPTTSRFSAGLRATGCGPTSCPTQISRPSGRATRSRVCTTWSCSRDITSTSHSPNTTSSSAIATSVGTSRGSRPTTSSGRSSDAVPCSSVLRSGARSVVPKRADRRAVPRQRRGAASGADGGHPVAGRGLAIRRHRPRHR